MGFVPRLTAALAHPRWPWLAALLGVALSLPALWQGLLLDDHLHRLYVTHVAAGTAPGRWWDLYTVAWDPATTREGMALGATPWWTLPDLRIHFWRPLSAATHHLDYRLWPDAPGVMHAHSLLWYAAVVVAAGAWLRRVFGERWTAGLATLLFAVSAAHAWPIAWIAHRNALLGTLAVAVALWAQHRGLARPSTKVRWLGPLAFGAALLCGEAAAGAMGYVLLQAIVQPGIEAEQRRPLRDALLGVTPYVVVLLGWRALYLWLGYGVFGSGVYVDPMREPGAFMAVAGERLAALMAGQWTGLEASGWAVPDPDAIGPFAVALAVVVGLVVVFGLLRRRAAFAVLVGGSLVALVPALSTAPHDRLLMLSSLGAAGAIALTIEAACIGHTRGGAVGRGILVVLALALVGVHGPVAAVERWRACDRLSATLSAAQTSGLAGLPTDPGLAEQTLVLVNTPPTLVASSLWVERAASGAVTPRALRVLGASVGPVIVQRPDAHSLRLQPVGGYLADPFTTVVRSPAHPLRPGERIELGAWSVTIEATSGHRPTSVLVRFDRPLDDPSLRFVAWQPTAAGDVFVPFLVPPVGGRAVTPIPAPKK